MKTTNQATSRELEIQQVQNAIANTDAKIMEMEAALKSMRQKQLARTYEIARQKTLAIRAKQLT